MYVIFSLKNKQNSIIYLYYELVVARLYVPRLYVAHI